MAFNLVGLLVVSAWRGNGLAAMFLGQSSVTVLLIANNAAQVCVSFVCIFCLCKCARVRAGVYVFIVFIAFIVTRSKEEQLVRGAVFPSYKYRHGSQSGTALV